MTVYEDLGPHPKKRTARAIVEYDSDGCGKAFLYCGFRRGQCYMELYPDDRETFLESGKKRIHIKRIKERKVPTVAATTVGTGDKD